MWVRDEQWAWMWRCLHVHVSTRLRGCVSTHLRGNVISKRNTQTSQVKIREYTREYARICVFACVCMSMWFACSILVCRCEFGRRRWKIDTLRRSKQDSAGDRRPQDEQQGGAGTLSHSSLACPLLPDWPFPTRTSSTVAHSIPAGSWSMGDCLCPLVPKRIRSSVAMKRLWREFVVIIYFLESRVSKFWSKYSWTKDKTWMVSVHPNFLSSFSPCSSPFSI